MVILSIILYPLILVLACPVGCVVFAVIACLKIENKCITCLGIAIFGPASLICGLVLNICFIPAFLIVTLCFILL